MTQILKLTLAACAILTAGSAIAAELPPSALGIFGTTTSICANPKAGTGRFLGIERQGTIVNLTFIDTGAERANCRVFSISRTGRGYGLGASCYTNESMRTRSSFTLSPNPYADAVTISMAGPGDPVETYHRCP